MNGAKGQLKLTDLKWVSASSGWGESRINRTVENKPIEMNGKAVNGIGTHAESIIIYDLPEGYETFSATGVVTKSGTVVFGVLVDNGQVDIDEESKLSIDFKSIGIKGKANVYDLWENKKVGVFKNKFSKTLPQHGAGLYRISPLR